jgi:hypothetical protein
MVRQYAHIHKSDELLFLLCQNKVTWYVFIADCYRTISIGEVSEHDLYYSLTHILKWKPFDLETCTDSLYLVLNFYQINEEGKIRTRDCLVIKILISCYKIISTQKLMLLGKIPEYDLYYSLTQTTTIKDYF